MICRIRHNKFKIADAQRLHTVIFIDLFYTTQTQPCLKIINPEQSFSTWKDAYSLKGDGMIETSDSSWVKSLDIVWQHRVIVTCVNILLNLFGHFT